MSADPFDTAVYYDCHDSETLTHETPADALEYFLDLFMTPDCDAAAVIAANGPYTVVAYKRMAIPNEVYLSTAGYTLEHFAEQLSEEGLLDPDGTSRVYVKTAYDAAHARIVQTLRELAATQPVWACERCAERVYTADQVLEMMREHVSWWFEPAKEPA